MRSLRAIKTNWSRSGLVALLAAPAALVALGIGAKLGLSGDALYLGGAIVGGMAVGALLRPPSQR
jgi:hypothetical protein